MNRKNSSRNVFDEIDKDMEQVKTAMKLSRHEQVLKKQIKVLKILIVFAFLLSISLIYLDVFQGYRNVNMPLAIIGLFLSVHSLVFLKIISKQQTKKGDKR